MTIPVTFAPPRDFMSPRCSSSRSWKTASSIPAGRTVSSNLRTAASPAAFDSAGLCIETRSNDRAGNGAWRASAQAHSTRRPPADSAASRARPSATSEMSIAVTDRPATPREPDRVGALTATDVERPAGSEVGDLGDEPFGCPLHLAPSRSLFLSFHSTATLLLTMVLLVHQPYG